MEIELRIKFSPSDSAEAEAGARQVFLLLAAKIIEAVTENGNNNHENRDPRSSTQR